MNRHAVRIALTVLGLIAAILLVWAELMVLAESFS